MKHRVIVIGASYNGVATLQRLVGGLPKDLPAAVFIVLHVPPGTMSMLPEILSKAGPLRAVHPADNERFEAGVIYVAPPDRHMLLHDGTILLSPGPRENRTRPSVDPLFRSAALAYGAAVVGIVLTGQLDDGTAGLMAVKDRGGVTIVQDPAEAPAPSMPRNALRYVEVDHRASITAISALIVRLANEPSPAPPQLPDELLSIENRIAAGMISVGDWRRLERHVRPAGLTCPCCGSALHQINDERVFRFRCRSGHAFGAESLLAAQAEGRRRLRPATFGALTEESALARQISRRPEYGGEPIRRKLLSEHAARLERGADRAAERLRDAVEPSEIVTPRPSPEDSGTPTAVGARSS